MRKLRIFIVELILVGAFVAWIYEKLPHLVGSIIPWIVFAILWHLTWEIFLEADWTKRKARIAHAKGGRMSWMIAFCIGGLISIGFLYMAIRLVGAVEKARLDSLASAPNGENNGKENAGSAKSPPASINPELARQILEKLEEIKRNQNGEGKPQ